MKMRLKLIKFDSSFYTCRECFTLTSKGYKYKHITVIACCPGCARKYLKETLLIKNENVRQIN